MYNKKWADEDWGCYLHQDRVTYVHKETEHNVGTVYCWQPKKNTENATDIPLSTSANTLSVHKNLSHGHKTCARPRFRALLRQCTMARRYCTVVNDHFRTSHLSAALNKKMQKALHAKKKKKKQRFFTYMSQNGQERRQMTRKSPLPKTNDSHAGAEYKTESLK